MWVRMVRACGNGVRSSEGLEKGGEGLKSITDSRGLVDKVNTAVPRLLLSRVILNLEKHFHFLNVEDGRTEALALAPHRAPGASVQILTDVNSILEL